VRREISGLYATDDFSFDRVKLLLDMNLSPTWLMVLEEAGFEVLHWSKVGKPSASDHEICDWAASNGYVIITHNLDFGTILAHSFARGPSVVQIRANDLSPDALQTILVAAIRSTEADLGKGAPCHA
jgi:predicted nuclease of predicted toxin-antitoxin system